MRLAIVGTGIAGLTAAYLLSKSHEISVFEAGDYVGGHTATTEVTTDDGVLPVDAGFIVYNEPNYPNFVRLLDRLGVETQPTSMSFSVKCESTGLEYAGTNLNTLFAQRQNLLRPGFYALLRDILRFNRAAGLAVANGISGTLGQFLEDNRLSKRLAGHYLIPMTAAIWSTEPGRILDAPAKFILRFLDNHKLLGTSGFHDWRVIKGGSARYVDKITSGFREQIRLRTPVRRLARADEGVLLSTDAGTEPFDEVVVATHSDQALAMLDRPTNREREVLGAIRYQPNPAILHTDTRVLPTRRRAWASWNYLTPRQSGRGVAVTYNMNRLQTLPTDRSFCVSLNLEESIRPTEVVKSFDFEHPIFDQRSVAAQSRHGEISGVKGIHYCGAYWRNGFHEDGVWSALQVTRDFGVSL